MAEWIQEGNHLDVIFPAGATEGEPVQVGGYTGLPGGTFAAAARGALVITGVISAEKATGGGSAFALGDLVDWDPDALAGDGAAVATGTGGVNSFFLGKVTQRDNVDADTRVEVRLMPESVEAAISAALSLNAEVANEIIVSVQVAPGVTTRLFAEVFDDAALHALVAAFTLRDASIGPIELTTSARPSLILDTQPDGSTGVGVTDVSGVFVGSVWLLVTPMGGTPQVIEAIFA